MADIRDIRWLDYDSFVIQFSVNSFPDIRQGFEVESQQVKCEKYRVSCVNADNDVVSDLSTTEVNFE